LGAVEKGEVEIEDKEGEDKEGCDYVDKFAFAFGLMEVLTLQHFPVLLDLYE
jgi:hypothetical protein